MQLSYESEDRYSLDDMKLAAPTRKEERTKECSILKYLAEV